MAFGAIDLKETLRAAALVGTQGVDTLAHTLTGTLDTLIHICNHNDICQAKEILACSPLTHTDTPRTHTCTYRPREHTPRDQRLYGPIEDMSIAAVKTLSLIQDFN